MITYSDEEGFFLTPTIGNEKVVLNSGCVTWACKWYYVAIFSIMVKKIVPS